MEEMALEVIGFGRYWGLNFGDIKIEIYFMHLGGENEQET